MSAPVKPWERAGVNYQNSGNLFGNNLSSAPMVESIVGEHGDRPLPSVANRNPPPLPSRPAQPSTMNSMMPYNSYGSSYGYGGYSSPYSSPYSSYSTGGFYGSGMYGGYGMNRYGPQSPYGGSAFARHAEESSRQAFQSVESIVQAFGSVAAMLDSTYSAVFNSFRAVLGVADQFSRMRQHFAQIFSALAVIKMFRWLINKLLVVLRLRDGTMTEEVWNDAVGNAMAAGPESPAGRGNWPIILFFAVILGGPYLIWKLLSSVASTRGDGWISGDDDHFVGVAEFDFESAQEDELSFRRGQNIVIAPKDLQPKMRGWLLATVDGQRAGIVPANYVRVMGKRRGRKSVSLANEQRPLASPPMASAGMADTGSSNSRPSASGTGRTAVTVADLEQTYTDVSIDNSSDSHGSNMGIEPTVSTNVNDRTASEILDQSEHRGEPR